MLRNIMAGNNSYWLEVQKTFGIEGNCTNILMCIKSSGDVAIEAFIKNGETRHIKALASRSFLIDLLSRMGMPVGNHVLEICLEIKADNLTTMTYVCGVDERIRGTDWKELTLFGEMR